MVAISLGIGAAASIGSVAIQASAASKQRKAAQAINPVDPGANLALQENARMLRERYGNYEMPGFQAAQGDINLAGQNAFQNATQGATSSGDLIDAASRIAYGTQRNMSDLYRQNAIGKEQALMQYLQANQAAGTDQAQWDRSEYLADVNRRAQLMNASELNRMNAVQQGLGGLQSLSAYSAGMFANNNQTNNPNVGGSDTSIQQVLPGASIERSLASNVSTPFAPSAPVNTVPQRSLNGQPYLDPVMYLNMRGAPVSSNYTLPYRNG